MARRNIKIDLRLNEQEMERLRRDVARSGWSREKYLRALIEHSSIREMPSMDLISVLRNLQQINNNMNQVALIANAKGFVDTAAYWENVELLKETMRRRCYNSQEDSHDRRKNQAPLPVVQPGQPPLRPLSR